MVVLSILFVSLGQAEPVQHRVICFHGPEGMIEYLKANWVRLPNIEGIKIGSSPKRTERISEAALDQSFAVAREIWQNIEDCSPDFAQYRRQVGVFEQLGAMLDSGRCSRSTWQNPQFVDFHTGAFRNFPGNRWPEIYTRFLRPQELSFEYLSFVDGGTVQVPPMYEQTGVPSRPFRRALTEFETLAGILPGPNSAALPGYRQDMPIVEFRSGVKRYCEVFTMSDF